MESLQNNSTISLEKRSPISPSNETIIEFVPKFRHIQEDLLFLFNIEVTSETSLTYEWVKKELLDKAFEEIRLGTPFALDYMFEEQLLSKEDIRKGSIQDIQPYAKTILKTYKGPRLTRAKNLFLDTGIFNQKETEAILSLSKEI
ncbi:MAG: hypothetical protein KBC41_00845 [Candidatus Pacebacteria bacterium]|nr:hypothetical protein [Candidatus Paceibacterota bacterium]MBP9866610.1 hypothetical protein [Candidatus Paceibacterota bacterium]